MWKCGNVEIKFPNFQIPQFPNSSSVFFFELFLDRRAEASGGAERFAVVVEGKTRDVDGLRAAGGLLVDDDRDRAAFRPFAERHAAPTGEARMREPFEHLTRFYYMEGARSAPARSGAGVAARPSTTLGTP